MYQIVDTQIFRGEQRSNNYGAFYTPKEKKIRRKALGLALLSSKKARVKGEELLDKVCHCDKMPDGIRCDICDLRHYREMFDKKNYKLDIPKEELYEMYIVQNMSGRDIGKHYGCSQAYISNLVVKYGIKR